MAFPTIDDVRAARDRIAGVSHHTTLTRSLSLSRALGADVRLKLESTQDTRAFKVRGAANVILSLSEDDRSRGVVAFSTGNHGRAVAHVAARVGIPATVCMSNNTTEDKRAALQTMGATVRVFGESQDDAAELAHRIVAEEGSTMVDPINDARTITGHGTLGLELLEDWPEVDTVVVPLSAGGLIAGVGLAVKSLKPGARVIGVSMDRGAAMYESLQAGQPVRVPEFESLADSLQGGISLDNRYTFEMTKKYVDDVVLLEEDEIATAMAHAVIDERLVLEGAGATPIAALLFRDRSLFGDRVALVASGAMVDPATLQRVVTDHGARAAEVLTKLEDR